MSASRSGLRHSIVAQHSPCSSAAWAVPAVSCRPADPSADPVSAGLFYCPASCRRCPAGSAVVSLAVSVADAYTKPDYNASHCLQDSGEAHSYKPR